MTDVIEIAKGQDFTFEVTLFSGTGDPRWPIYAAQLSGDADIGSTTLPIEALKYALLADDMLSFDGYVVQLTADAAAGDRQLSVTATTARLLSKQIGKRLQDLTSYTIEAQILKNAGDTVPIITYSGAAINIPSQSAPNGRGRVQISGVVADTSLIVAQTYYGAVWRRNDGSTRPLSEFEFKVTNKGFLS